MTNKNALYNFSLDVQRHALRHASFADSYDRVAFLIVRA